MKASSVYECSIIELNKHHHESGNITVVENMKNIPFETRRVYYLYDVPGGESRGGHAHKELNQLIIAASGSFDVVLNDGITKRSFILNRPYLFINWQMLSLQISETIQRYGNMLSS